MRKIRLFALTTLALAACGGGAGGGLFPGLGGGGGGCGGALSLVPGGNASPRAEPAGASQEVVFMLRPGASRDAVLASQRLGLIAQFGQRPIYRARVPEGSTVDAVVAALRADTARVMFAEANGVGSAPESRRCSVWSIGGGDAAAQLVSYRNQPARSALRLDAAQVLSQGENVRVAVLDTGVDRSHPALAGRLLPGYDFVDDDADPSEAGSAQDAGFGHGTHVAGLVALVAPQARILPVRVLDAEGGGNAWVLAEALNYAVDPDGRPATDDGAHVVNFSLGTTRPTRLLELALRIAACDLDDDDGEDDFADPGFDADRQRCLGRRGAAVIAAAGNDGSTSQIFPAAEAFNIPIAGALAVTATNTDLIAPRLAAFANRGPWVGLAAPGQAITGPVPGGAYAVWHGSSMAAPLAAGTAALLIASGTGPDPQGFTGLRSWSPMDVTQRLRDRSAALCDASGLRQLDSLAAVDNSAGLDPACP